MSRAWLAGCVALGACGRIGFGADPFADAALGDAAPNDATPDATPDARTPTNIEWVTTFIATPLQAGASVLITVNPVRVGDAFLMLGYCDGGTPTALTVSAPGWTFVQAGGLVILGSARVASVYAIAPTTATSVITVMWSGSTCPNGRSELGDEFTNATGDGNGLIVDGFEASAGMGAAQAIVLTMHADDAIWSAAYSSVGLTSTNSAYTKTADNGGGDWSEYRVTTDPSDTAESPSFGNPTGSFVIAAFSLAAL